MKFNSRSFFAALAGVLMLASCAKEQTESFNKIEDMALEAWITQNRPDLVKNLQSYGDARYYIDVLDAGNPDASPISDTVCWVKFDFTGRDLSGNIVLTRNASAAKLAGTFTKFTHYVPFYRYCGTENTGLIEGTYLAMRQKQVLDAEYFDTHKNDPSRRFTSPEVLLREGAKVVLYMPSRVVGSGLSGDGGYQGQYSLGLNRPVIITMEISDTIKNPLEAEGSAVDTFCNLPANGGLQIYTKAEDKKAEDPGITLPTDPTDPNHPYNISQRWVSASDSVPQVYVNYRWMPGEKMTYPEPYAVGIEPYVNESSLVVLNQKIADAVKKRFDGVAGAKAYEGVVKLDADSVKMAGTAKFWYITRLLDGFVVDTNIDEVSMLAFGELRKNKKGVALEYTPEKGDAIKAFSYVFPNLKFGQWVSIITASTNAYGAQGQAGTTSSSSSSSSSGFGSGYSDYMNYMSYANNYYGNSYGGYYNDYYGGGGYGGGYGNGYYDPYYGSGMNYNFDNSSASDDAVKVISTSSEIPPFTPLVFELYIEPAEE